MRWKIPDIKYHEQILFIFVYGNVIWGAYNYSENSVKNLKRGIQAGLFVLIFEATLKSYKGPFLRPNLAFWRGVARFCLIYLVALVFLVFQNEFDARHLMKHLYPELGKPVPKDMHTYDDHCDLKWENIYDNLDHYYLCHIVNWFLAALIVRDPYLLHFWSVLDEIIELSWQHVLPHFRECWWDHVFLDVLLSNTPSIIIGIWFIRKVGITEYDWLGRKGKKSFKDWDVFKWYI